MIFSVWKTRLILWKKQILLFLFWLCFPIVGTISILLATENFRGDTKIPVGIVMEEDTHFANDLYEGISSSPFLRIVNVTELEAREMVRAHKLDSAFIIKEGFEEDIKAGNRNWIITGYSANLSIGYVPIKEMIISLVQEKTGKSKAAQTVQKLSENSNRNWTWEEIVMKTDDIQLRENLLFTNFAFQNKKQIKDKEGFSLWNIWMVWSALSFIATSFLFDWVIKEKTINL